jgi:V/A-type H+-transporting ATPase subunit G/H
MKKVDVLLEVKETEEKVEKLKEDALREKERIVKDSKRESIKVLDEAKTKAQNIYKAKIDTVNKEIEHIRKRIIGEGEERASELKTKAKENLNKAVDLLVTKFENEVGNA